jgi:hypothetical protein
MERPAGILSCRFSGYVSAFFSRTRRRVVYHYVKQEKKGGQEPQVQKQTNTTPLG